MLDDAHWMQFALEQAKLAQEKDEVPIGAVLVKDDEIIASGFNRPISLLDPTAHAEIICLRNAAKQLNNYRLPGTTLYVSLEPCAMCAGAMVNCRLGKLVYGIKDSKYGAAGSAMNVTCFDGALHKINVIGGVLENECLDIFQRFFKKLRTKR